MDRDAVGREFRSVRRVVLDRLAGPVDVHDVPVARRRHRRIFHYHIQDYGPVAVDRSFQRRLELMRGPDGYALDPIRLRQGCKIG